MQALLNELPADAQAMNTATRKRASVAKRSNDRSPRRDGDHQQDDDAQRQGLYARTRPQLKSQAQRARQLTKQGPAKQLDEEALQQTSLAIYSTHQHVPEDDNQAQQYDSDDSYERIKEQADTHRGINLAVMPGEYQLQT